MNKINKLKDEFLKGQCPICKRILRSNVGRDKYVAMVHNTQTLYCCCLCNTICETRSEMSQHHRQHHFTSRQIHCGICGSQLSSNFALRQHRRKKHQLDLTPNNNIPDLTPQPNECG